MNTMNDVTCKFIFNLLTDKRHNNMSDASLREKYNLTEQQLMDICNFYEASFYQIKGELEINKAISAASTADFENYLNTH